VVILSDMSGGNICVALNVRIVSWKSDGSYTATDKFGNCQGPEITQEGNKVTLFFDSYVGRTSQKKFPSETWVFESGKLTLVK